MRRRLQGTSREVTDGADLELHARKGGRPHDRPPLAVAQPWRGEVPGVASRSDSSIAWNAGFGE